jgi:hypothetical protein
VAKPLFICIKKLLYLHGVVCTVANKKFDFYGICSVYCRVCVASNKKYVCTTLFISRFALS